MVQIQGVFAELDKSLLVAKLRKAKCAKRANGERAEGPAPYGQKPGESETLHRIRRLRAQGHASFQQIADRLNSDRVPTRMGGLWHKGTVAKVCGR